MSDAVKPDAIDRALIVATQGGLPLVARPYQVVNSLPLPSLHALVLREMPGRYSRRTSNGLQPRGILVILKMKLMNQ